jgi:diguanylate cyclase (GGDEF)-like protein/PAS domain S-box-containing protein
MHQTEQGMSSGSPGRSGLNGTQARGLLLSAGARDVLDRLTRLAALALRAPVAMLGVVEEERLVLASGLGVPEPWQGSGYIPLEATFCRHVQRARDAQAVDDAARHPLGYSVARLENFPRVAYCGAPLLLDGETVAVLSVADTQPRRWTAEDVSVIRDLAAAALRDVELLAESGRQPAAAGSPAPETSWLPDSLFSVDADWRITGVNDRAREMFGLDAADSRGRRFWDVFPDLVGSTFHQEFLRAVAERTPYELEDFCESAQIWLEVRSRPTADGGATLQLRDVTARRRAEDELRGREARYRRLFEESRAPLFVMAPDGTLVESNHAFAELVGRQREELAGLKLDRLATDEDAFRRMIDELRTTGSVTEAEVPFAHGTAGELVCVVTGAAHPGEDGGSYHCAVRDITVQKRAQEELVRTAFHDPLTGLPNRLVFMDRLERVVQHARRRPGHGFAVLFLDLDNFKQVNDTLGHLAGDQLLITVARRLESCVRQEDTVARIGGDEFAVLLDMIQDIGGVTLVVDRIRESLSEPFAAGGRETGTSASIGVAVALNNYERAEDLLRDADTAMYRAKAAGRNGYVIFDGDMHERYLAQRQLEDDLRGAVERQQLAVHYQPVVRLDTGSVTGMEALVRWTHPERGILLPAEFMPMAEQTGLIVEMGWWVLREACRQLREWQREYPDAAFRLTMSVNLSARQFVHPDLVSKLDEILEETGLDPSCLRLDLTEAVVMQNADLATRMLRQLRERGIHICIDDFGTGYTSLRQLREFPISTLKIDRSFIHRLQDEEAGGREIVQSIIALGRSMAIDAVAEGVETPEQLEQLRRLGTRFAQGFLFSLPLDTAAAGALLHETRQ